eukprot:1157272-Pelagomonas_calceolata.AAC.5
MCTQNEDSKEPVKANMQKNYSNGTLMCRAAGRHATVKEDSIGHTDIGNGSNHKTLAVPRSFVSHQGQVLLLLKKPAPSFQDTALGKEIPNGYIRCLLCQLGCTSPLFKQ